MSLGIGRAFWQGMAWQRRIGYAVAVLHESYEERQDWSSRMGKTSANNVTDMRAMAARRLAGGRALPLQTTELVHEAFARLLEKPLQVKDRVHFFRTVAMVLRQVLTDAIRHERAEKRGGGALAVSLSAAGDLAVVGPEAWLSIDTALAELEVLDARKCRVVEMSILLGLEQADIAQALDVSVPTVERDLRFARAWLRERLVH
jgi:RNA polymerase sigma factor (TIGR02999 family)